MPGWVWMLFGLAVGLSAAAAIYINDRNPQRTAPATPETSEQTAESTTRKKPEPATKSAPRFTFYDMLPNFEVVIPEEAEDVRGGADRIPLDLPGIYVLQAGSFSSYADADRVKAQLALLGVVSNIQKVSIDDKVYHRVRIGPVEDLDELNPLREKLRQAQVEVIVIRVGE